MNLAIDIGTSQVKLAIIDNGQVVDNFRTDNLSEQYIQNLLDENEGVKSVIMSTTREQDLAMERFIAEHVDKFVIFDHNMPTPLKNLYATPETLGMDRLAAAVGASAIYPKTNLLIVDFGSAITIDRVSAEGEYLGGNISPGVSIRFKALHQFTQRLPLRALTANSTMFGDTTNTAIENGVINGITYEIEGYIAHLERENKEFRIIFTGWDGNFFANRLKNTIFVTHDLVVYGLDRILEYNAK